MPYADPNQMREYQRVWSAKLRKARRDEWISENGPCADCGSWENLEGHHVNPEDKEFPLSQIWHRREEVRVRELAKCVVLCSSCHLGYTKPYLSEYFSNCKPVNAKLTDEEASEIKYMIHRGDNFAEIGRKFGVSRNVVKDISRGKTYKNAPVEIQESFNFA